MLNAADFQRIQTKLQNALEGESIENSIAALSGVLVVSICCGTPSERRAHQTLDRVFLAMHGHINHSYAAYVRDYERLSRGRPH